MAFKTIFGAFLAFQSLEAVSACPLHLTAEHTVLNNVRRSNLTQHARTAIEHVRVFNGQLFDAPKTVCLDGGHIVSFGNCSGAQVTVDGAGKFLIPGLIDNHLHLTDVKTLEDFTSYGCTTAMHMNCGNYTQCHIMANQPGLASFYFATMSAMGNGTVHAENSPMRPKNTLIYPNTDVVEWTERQFNNGSNYLKITAETNGPSTEQQLQMVDLVHSRYGKQTMTHASDIEAYGQAVYTKTDGIQHVPDDGVLDSATIQKIIEQGQFVTPTLNVFEYAYRDPVLQQYFHVKPGSNRTLDHARTNARLLYEAGAPIVAGTDSVGAMVQNGTTVTVPFGITLHFELENLVERVGMSPSEAINAATREAAKWHRLRDRGSIELGKRADLVLLNSNPLINITNTRDIAKIWVFGAEAQRYEGEVTVRNPANLS